MYPACESAGRNDRLDGVWFMAWKSLKRAVDFAAFIGVEIAVLRSARRQRSYIYVEADKWNAKKKKLRHLCYPPFDSDLRKVQKALTDKCLSTLPLSAAVCGYLPGRHNINCASPLAGIPYVAKIDIKDFHPSITPKLVTAALRRHGVSEAMCRIITQLVTYKGCIPQGGLSSKPRIP